MKKCTVDIIGAGVSGLSTAYYLSKTNPNVKIRVWEKDKLPGGLASNFYEDGIEIEKFYHHLFIKDKALQQLICDLGLSEDLIWKPASTGSYYSNKPYRLSSPSDLLKFSPLPFLDRIRMGFLVLKTRTIKSWKVLDEISAQDFVIKYGGQKVWDVVWKPLFYGKFGQFYSTVSAAWLWSKLVDRGSSRSKSGFELLGFIKGGFGKVFERIVLNLQHNGHEVNFDTPITNLEIKGNRIISIENKTRKTLVEYIVFATQTPDLAKLLPKNMPFKQSLSKINFLSNVCLVLFLKKSLSNFYWTNITDPSTPFVGIIEQTKWTGTRIYNNKHVVYISSYILADNVRLKMTKQELFDYYLPHIKKMFPEFSESNIEKMYKWSAPYAQPIVHKGYNKIIPPIESPIDNLFVCTMAQIYPNDRQVSNGVEMGIKTTDLINRKIKSKIIDG